jgi:signal transduction histidine kinase
MGADAPRRDNTLPDLLSAVAALSDAAKTMTESRDPDEILELAVSVVPSLGRDCRSEAVWLDGAWRFVDRRRTTIAAGAHLQDQIMRLGGADGPLEVPDLAWVHAFPLGGGRGVSGHLVVSAPNPPPDQERALIETLSQLTGVALGSALMVSNEQDTRDRIADEQATVRRIATLVSEAVQPEEVFAAVAAEAQRLRNADFVTMSRYNADGSATVVGTWPAGDAASLPVGSRVDYGSYTIHSLIFDTRRPARIEDYGESGFGAEIVQRFGIRCVVGVPIQVSGELWGAIGVASTRGSMAPDTERWLAGFTELIAAAIANAQARLELRAIAEEQSSLRRFATLVARAPSRDELFAAVASEVGTLLDADFTVVGRYDPDGAVAIEDRWTMGESKWSLPIDARVCAGERDVLGTVYRTGRPARADDHHAASGTAEALGYELGIRSAVAVPIVVEQHLWGAITVGTNRELSLPSSTEEQLVAFTELVGTALANAAAHEALTVSRARIVAAADTARHRIERDLHDGAQQQIVSSMLRLRAIQGNVPPGERELLARLEELADGLNVALEELQELARGIHPAALAKAGLSAALEALAARSAVPVTLDVVLENRPPEPVELAAYYVVSEALANVVKHAEASVVEVHVWVDDDLLHVDVLDDGCGGADLTRGSGLIGLADRVEALRGGFEIQSPSGAGTSLRITLPLATG